MGNDGGSIPTRRELVKEAAKALTTTQIKEAQQESQEHAWSHDPLTRKPLSTPIVSDSAGTLYNKDSIIEYLLSPEKDEEQVKVVGGRVSGLKDVVEVKFEVEEEQEGGEKRGANVRKGEKWVCPVTREEMGPSAKAVYLVPCGHAFAGSVVREVKERICVQCNETYAENDIIPILPTSATDIARLNLRVKTLKENNLTHALKKAAGGKKRKKADKLANAENTDPAKPSSSEEDKKDGKLAKKPGATNGNGNGINHASTAYLTKKVLEEQEERNKRRKMGQNDNVKSLFRKDADRVDPANSKDYMTRGFSIGKK